MKMIKYWIRVAFWQVERRRWEGVDSRRKGGDEENIKQRRGECNLQ